MPLAYNDKSLLSAHSPEGGFPSVGDCVRQPVETGLVLFDDLRFKFTCSVAGNRYVCLAKLPFNGFLAMSIPGWGRGSLSALLFDMSLHFSFRAAFDQGFGQLLEDATFSSGFS